MKKIVITLALIVALLVPSTASACGRNYYSRHHHHHFFFRHHVEQVVVPVAPIINDGSYEYYHNVLGYTKAQYLIQIKKMP